MDNPPLPNSLSYYVQKKTKKKHYKAQFFTTTSQVSRHPETIHGSHQGLFGADGIQIVFESLELP
jgi:hypothetical protein